MADLRYGEKITMPNEHQPWIPLVGEYLYVTNDVINLCSYVIFGILLVLIPLFLYYLGNWILYIIHQVIPQVLYFFIVIYI